jgi:hypothetical protein
MNYDILLTEDMPSVDVLDLSDRIFLSEKLKLIEIKNDRIYSKFVGEIITPNSSIFSLPKNLEDKELIEPIKELLKKYKHRGGNLSLNSTFTLSKSGEYKSESYFFKRLKSFFLDFVTYEFIYPEETKKIHSIEPMMGRIDIVQTKINRKIYGDGITYDVIDKENNDDWILDDVYYFVMKTLSELVGSSSEILEIKRMRDYLIDEGGFYLNEIRQEDDFFIMETKETKKDEKKFTLDQIVEKIKKCNVNIIHNPIKNTLLEYFKNKKLSNSSFKINVFYTKNFEYVWEDLVQVTLKHNPVEFGSLVDKFKKTVRFKDYVTKSELKDYLKANKITKYEIDDKNYITYTGYDAKPDIFSCGVSEYSKTLNLKEDKLMFIGDAKYYNNLKSYFHKEFSTYNLIQENIYPMIVLVPSNRTYIPMRGSKYGDDVNDMRELIIINISIKDIINDYLDKTFKVLSEVHMLISKRSKRLTFQKN